MKKCLQCGKEYDDSALVCPVDQSPLAPHNASGPLTGSLLAERYLIGEKIGQGGMGVVYRAVHVKMDRPCAIKILIPLATQSAEAVARFNREAKLASRIENPHAVTIYDFGEAEKATLYLAMEFVDGDPLTRILAREGSLSPARAVRIARQIADALSAAHAIGIIHRDLKPDNIMIGHKGGESDYVKVLDFGIAKTIGDDGGGLTQTGSVIGTPVYMSPEQLSGEALDARSDLYSLALIVYQMIAGKLPFEGDSVHTVMMRRLIGDPIPLRSVVPAVSEALERAVMVGLVRTPSGRPTLVQDFAAGLEQAALESGIAVEPRSGNTGNVQANLTTPIAASHHKVTERGMPLPPGAGGETSGATPAQSDAGEIRPSPTYITNRTLAQQHDETPTRNVGATPESASTPMNPPVAAPAAPASASMPAPGPTRSGPAATPVAHPAAGHRSPMYPPANVVAPVKAGKGGMLIGLAVVAVLGILAVGAVLAYIFYFKPPPRPGSNSNAGSITSRTPGGSGTPSPTPSSTATPGGDAADLAEAEASYESGRRHVKQAALQNDAGLRTAEYTSAIADFRRAVQKRPLYPEAHENLGAALYTTGDPVTATDEYRTAIDQYTQVRNGPTAKVMTNYGLALFEMKQYRGAADAFDRALSLDPSDHELYVHRGYALQNSGDLQAATADYKQYLALEPNGQYAPDVRQILAGKASPPTDSGNH